MSFIYVYAFIFSHSLAFCHIYFLLLFFFLWHSWLLTPPPPKKEFKTLLHEINRSLNKNFLSQIYTRSTNKEQ